MFFNNDCALHGTFQIGVLQNEMSIKSAGLCIQNQLRYVETSRKIISVFFCLLAFSPSYLTLIIISLLITEFFTYMQYDWFSEFQLLMTHLAHKIVTILPYLHCKRNVHLEETKYSSMTLICYEENNICLRFLFS